jgi:replicative DNA helicase
MSIFDASLGRIKDGKYGLNKGIPHHLNKLEPYMPAINKGTYYLIGADTGSGKTAFVDDLFLYNTFDYYMANKDKMKLNINYFSLEIDSVNKIVKGMVRKLLLDYGINNIDTNYILSRGKNRISDEIYQKVLGTRKYFEELEDVIKIYDNAVSPNDIRNVLNSVSDRHFIEHQNIIKPKHSNHYIINVVDHVGLIKNEPGFNKKQSIDYLSSNVLIPTRNKFGMINVIVQQLNRNTTADGRKGESISPMLSDFKETGSTQEDANMVIALFNPDRYNISVYRKMPIDKTFRTATILKNRDGEAGAEAILKMHGPSGHFNDWK